MPKRARADHPRRRAQSSRKHRDVQQPAAPDLVSRGSASASQLLDRLLTAPHLATVVPRLQPEVLHRVIEHVGLEDCGPLVALVTPDQLSRVFDLDLWRATSPGHDERFDAARFGLWLAVLLDAGESSAAATVASLDPDLVASALAEHVRVIDYAAVSPFISLEGELVSPGFLPDTALQREIGGFVIVAKVVAAELQPRGSSDAWDAITGVLAELSDSHGGAFERIMRRCCRLSSSLSEVDGLDDLLTARDQAMFDVGVGRETRRDAQGFVTPARARAFLQASREIDLRRQAPPPRDAMSEAYFGSLAVQSPPHQDARPADLRQAAGTAAVPDAPAEAIAAILDLLQQAGAIPRPPFALLEAPAASAPKLARIRALLHSANEHDPMASANRQSELVYLANALVTGSTIQSRPMAADEASDAAVAVCNLGLEHWPALWLTATYVGQDVSTARDRQLPDDFLVRHDLVRVFQVGWTVLHQEVCMHAAEMLIAALATAHCADDYIREGLETLQSTLTTGWRAGTPWDAREALDVLAMLDTPAWVAVAGLIDQFPILHAAVGASLTGTALQIDPSAFEFISEDRQIQTVRDFMRVLPRILRT